MAKEGSSTPLPSLTLAAMSPSDTVMKARTRHDDDREKAHSTKDPPKLLFALAKNPPNGSNFSRSKKHVTVARSTSMKRAQASNQSVATNSRISRSDESKSMENEDAPSSAKPDQDFVVHVRETLERLLTQLDTVDPRKLLAVRLGGELRGLLGKAQDEFAAYEGEFLVHVSNDGVAVALQNFSASIAQVSGIADRLRTAKFLLNRTFKREILFAFQEINSYYTSLFMELSMAVARRSGVHLPLPSPVTPPPSPKASRDEICLEAHQYFFGHGVTKNLGKALELYTRAADLGCTVALTCLGQMFFAGNGTEKDLLVAQTWLERAASAGDIEACHQLGLLMCEKAAHLNDTRQSDDLVAHARVRFLQAAEQGHREAQYEIGVFHEYGRGGYESNDMEASRWYGKAADQGHTEAEASLGRLFLVGIHLQHDVAKAVHFLQRAAAKNDSSAQTRLGVLYTTGNGVKQDLERGMAYLQSAASAGSSVAMTRLANLLLLHSPSTASPSSAHYRDREEYHDEALRLLLCAGNGGHPDAYYALGNLFETSSFLRDQSAALRFYIKATTAASPHTASAKRVATMYYSGIGCTADKTKAHDFYAIAATAGDPEALNALGLMYEEGEGCVLNFQKAAEYYRSAIELKSPHAHFNLGCLLLHGKGVARNEEAARAYFQKATDLGYTLAQRFVLDEAQ